MRSKKKAGKKPKPDAYKHENVVKALERLFHGKCAYCEAKYGATQKAAVDHFRPKGKVLEKPEHPGYWWLAATWTNLLPTCTDCNSERTQETFTTGDGPSVRRVSGKGMSFDTADGKWVMKEGPVRREKPLLLDPTKDRPERYISFEVDIDGQKKKKTVHAYSLARSGAGHRRAQETIDVLGLNRSGLTTARREHLSHLQERGADILDALEKVVRRHDTNLIAQLKNLTARLIKFTEPDQPYSAMARVYVAAFQEHLRTRERKLRAQMKG